MLGGLGDREMVDAGAKGIAVGTARYCRMAAFVLLLAVSLLLPFGRLGAAGENLVPNPDFSEGAGPGGYPVDWTFLGGSRTNYVELSDRLASSGAYSVRFVAGAEGVPMGLRSRSIPVTPGEPYEAEVDVYLVDAQRAMLYLEWWDAAGNRIVADTATERATGEWKTLQVVAVAPREAQYATLYLYSSSANVGEMFFDNVRFRRSQGGTLPPGLLDGDDPVADAAQLDYSPADGHVSLSNPPSFIWIPIRGTSSYTLEYASDPEFHEANTYRVEGLQLSVYTPSHTLRTDTYWYWRVTALDAAGRVVAQSRARRFSIHPDAAELPLPPLDELKARIPAGHPRLFVTPDLLPRFIEARTSDPVIERVLWPALVRHARTLVVTPLPPEPPHARPGGVWDVNLWRQYTLAVTASENLQTLAFAYMLTGDPDYGAAARRLMLHIASWDPKGATSALVNDEASMPVLQGLTRAYTWAYDALTSEDRKVIQDVIRIRGAEAWAQFRNRPWESRPFISHGTRQMLFLFETAIAFLGEIPEAEEWFDYIIQAAFAVYPVWGQDPGGWAQGQAYWSTQIARALQFVDVLRVATGLDLFERPFFKNSGFFKLYTHPPYAKIGPFGDHADRPPNATDAVNMRQYAVRYNNPYFEWYARQLGGGIEQGVLGYIQAVYRPVGQVEPAVPLDLPPARYFADVGWVAMHRRLGDAQDSIQFMFKSSPYGSFNHSMADQNTFTLEAYGEPLAISSGYRPWYGSDHHMGWTKTTQAHNGVLVNGQGQIVDSLASRGVITGFLNGLSFDYTAGDALEAYGGLLDRAMRRVVYVRPDVFVIFDDLQAPQPSTYSWLLHSYQEMQFDESEGTIVVPAPRATLQVRLWASSQMAFSQTNQFAVPLDEPMNVPEQWHFTATTVEKADEGYFLAVLRPTRATDQSRFAAEQVPVEGGHGVRIELPDLCAEIAFAAGGQGVESASLRSDGEVAAYSVTPALQQGVLLVGGTRLETDSGLRVSASRRVDAELTLTSTTVEGVVDAGATPESEPVVLELTLPGVIAVSAVEAEVDAEWSFQDGVLLLRLAAKPGQNAVRIQVER